VDGACFALNVVLRARAVPLRCCSGLGDGGCVSERPTSPALRASLRCSRRAGSRRTRFAQTAAIPNPPVAALLGGASTATQRHNPHHRGQSRGVFPLTSSLSLWERAGVRAAASTSRRARYAVRCGRPLCAAEERSVSRTRDRSCLSEASSARPRETRAPQGSPKGRHSGADRAAPRTGRSPWEHSLASTY